METYLLSPFHYSVDTDFDVIKNKKDKKINLLGNEVAIMRGLAKYKVLNKKCIVSYLKRVQPGDRQKDSYDKEINQLFKGGYIIKYQYPNKDNGRENIVLYALSSKGIEYATSKKIKVALKSNIPELTPVLDTVSALEVMTLNSWHTRVLECLSTQIITELYDCPARVAENKNVVVPSGLTIRNGKEYLLEEMSVFAIVFNKENTVEAEGNFLNKLLAVNSFIKKNRRLYKNAFIVVLAESFIEIERASIKIQSYTSLSQLQVYYAIDEYVNELNPLNWLYDVKHNTEDGTTKYAMINLLQRKERDTV